MNQQEAAPSPRITAATAPSKRKLTEIGIQKLQPRAQPYLVWDTHQRGLAVRVQPSGHKSWKAIYRFHGRPRWYSIADVGAIGLAEARKLCGDVMYAVAQGKDPAAEKRAGRNRGTFAELAERYRDEHAKKKNKSWEHADRIVQRYLIPKWGKLQAHTITRADVKALIGGIAAPVLATSVLACASAIFSWAIREDVLTENPCKLVTRNKPNKRERVLAESEHKLFWEAFDEHGLEKSTALKLILLLGQRSIEVRHLHRAHIIDGWWEMPGKPDPRTRWPGTKNGDSHRVWLPKPALELLKDLPEEGLLLANERGNVMDDAALATAMRAICKRLGIVNKVTPHDLRRTHGTTITEMGFGREAMDRIENHRDSSVGSIYDRHAYAEEDKQIMEAVAARIMARVEGKPVLPTNVVQADFGKAAANIQAAKAV